MVGFDEDFEGVVVTSFDADVGTCATSLVGVFPENMKYRPTAIPRKQRMATELPAAIQIHREDFFEGLSSLSDFTRDLVFFFGFDSFVTDGIFFGDLSTGSKSGSDGGAGRGMDCTTGGSAEGLGATRVLGTTNVC